MSAPDRHAHTIIGVRPESWQRGGYAPNSETPPWGWPIVIALGMGVCGLLLFGPTMAARIIGI